MKSYKTIFCIVSFLVIMQTACTDDVNNVTIITHEISFDIEASRTIETRSIASPQSQTSSYMLISEDDDSCYLQVETNNMDSSLHTTTRGAQKTASNLQTDGFKVSAYNSADGTTRGTAYFEFLTASYADSKFTPQSAGTAKYWPVGKLMFYAYYPAAVPATNGITQETNATTLTYTVPATPANHPDLMTAKLTNQQYTSGDGTASLTFNHALCAIMFQTGTDIAAGTINSITFSNVYTSGTYSLDGNTWSGQTTGSLSFTGLGKVTADNMSGTAILTDGNTLMMIPQTFNNNNQKITIDYTDAYGVNLQFNYILNGTAWTAGQCITYNIGGVRGITKVTDQTRNPLWYMAKYNSNLDGTFDKTNLNCSNGNYRWGLSDAITQFSGSSTREGYYTQGLVISNRDTEDNSARYHLPTKQEWLSIVPRNSSENNYSLYYRSGEYVNIEAGLLTELPCIFHHSSAHTATAYTSYWSESINSSVNFTRYAVRFLGTNYCSVWSYKALDVNPSIVLYDGSSYSQEPTSLARFEIKSEVIESISSSNTAKLTAIINALKNGTYVWSAYAVTRSLWACGYCGSNTGTVNYEQGRRGLYSSATPYSDVNAWYFNFGWQKDASNNICPYDYKVLNHQNRHGLSVRLFRD